MISLEIFVDTARKWICDLFGLFFNFAIPYGCAPGGSSNYVFRRPSGRDKSTMSLRDIDAADELATGVDALTIMPIGVAVARGIRFGSWRDQVVERVLALAMALLSSDINLANSSAEPDGNSVCSTRGSRVAILVYVFIQV